LKRRFSDIYEVMIMMGFKDLPPRFLSLLPIFTKRWLFCFWGGALAYCGPAHPFALNVYYHICPYCGLEDLVVA